MSWQNAPVLRKLTASQQGGNRGAQLWGVDIQGTLHTIYQRTPGGAWSDWMSSVRGLSDRRPRDPARAGHPGARLLCVRV